MGEPGGLGAAETEETVMGADATRLSGEQYEGPPLKRIEFLVLAILDAEPLHGYGIALEIQERTGGRTNIRPGSLYRVLARLQRRGLLERAGRRQVRDTEDERRTDYRLTPLGRVVALEEAEVMSRVASRLVAAADKPRPEPA
ncbi:PadR family transcriptional regulator [Gemmatimonadota bacterium]